jgi:hypothetical protein
VSAIPARISETRVGAVVVLFLPPPDRPRMVQILKNHTEKIIRLADTWTVRGGVRLRSSVADLPDTPAVLPNETPARETVRDSKVEK